MKTALSPEPAFMMKENMPLLPNSADALQPVSPGERIPALDVIRGFALLGVLLAYALWNLGNPPESTYSSLDHALDWMLTALVDTKSYTLLACLFGLGFSIQLTRAAAHEVNIVPVYCRKLLVLILIGLTHALLLRNGDILVPYAVMGFVLLFFRNASNKTLAFAAIISLMWPHLLRSAWTFTGMALPQRPATANATYLADNYAWVRYWYTTAIFSWPGSLPMFLFGLYLGRRRFFEHNAVAIRGLLFILCGGFGLGVLAYAGRWLLEGMSGNFLSLFTRSLALNLLWSAHAWGLAACYASVLLLLLQRRAWQQWLAPFGAVGRMALTNYLLQAALIVPVCLGFDLFDKVTPSLGLLLALVVWAFQVPASVWWLKHFRFGPAEWLWRSLTYGQPQPMRVLAKPALAAVV